MTNELVDRSSKRSSVGEQEQRSVTNDRQTDRQTDRQNCDDNSAKLTTQREWVSRFLAAHQHN